MEPDEDTLMMDMQLRAVATASPMEMQASLASAFSVLGNSVIHPDLHLHDARRTKTVATAWRCVKLTSKGWRRRTDTHLPRPLHAHLHHAPSYYNHIYWRQRHWLKSERCEEQPARDGCMKIGGCSDDRIHGVPPSWTRARHQALLNQPSTFTHATSSCPTPPTPRDALHDCSVGVPSRLPRLDFAKLLTSPETALRFTSSQ